jgi:predicted signal transduction protein with EAL and GGDEF domain
MGLEVVAEGVEDEETLRRIAGYGCQQAQGYHLSKPMQAPDFMAWLESFKPRPIVERRRSGRAFGSSTTVTADAKEAG